MDKEALTMQIIPQIGKNTDIHHENSEKTIVLAGGCFWGTQAYLQKLPGVKRSFVCYANGKTMDPDYREVCSGHTDHVEAVFVVYDPLRIDLSHLLHYYFLTFDPTQVNRQGNDHGRQYRSGIYYLDPEDLPTIQACWDRVQSQHQLPLATEILPLANISRAEDEHQDYLTVHPGGYCHVSFASLPPADAVLTGDTEISSPAMAKADPSLLRRTLSPLSFEVTQNAATERPFSSELNQEWGDGIYVDIVSGEALFSSRDKFDAGCGWPSFTKSLKPGLLKEEEDYRLGYLRTEVRSKEADSHLGHVFPDGPQEAGGLRYCINGAALRFVPKEKMAEEGYQDYLDLFADS